MSFLRSMNKREFALHLGMFLLWLLLALSMWSMLVTTKGRVVDNTLPFEFGLDAFIGRNCCKVLGPETLMIQVTLELVTPPCHSVNAKKVFTR